MTRGEYGKRRHAAHADGWIEARTNVIWHNGLMMMPLTAETIRRFPDLDPVKRDASIAPNYGGALDPRTGRTEPRLIRDVYRPGDLLYFWDGPWGKLHGSRGIAVVRNGHVVATFTGLMA